MQTKITIPNYTLAEELISAISDLPLLHVHAVSLHNSQGGKARVSSDRSLQCFPVDRGDIYAVYSCEPSRIERMDYFRDHLGAYGAGNHF